MQRFPWARQVLVPAAAAVLIAVLFAGTNPAAAAHEAHGRPTSAQPSGSGGLAGQAATVDHSSHGAATVTPLARDCTGAAGSRGGSPVLSIHDGFQEAPTCSTTEFGEVPSQANSPSLLIVDAPRVVRVGAQIRLKISTLNLVRDRFLGAAAGGYYLETSLLNGAGLVRGHFHSACQVLGSTREAPAPDRQASFLATEDGGGSSRPDTVTVTLPPLTARGIARCTVWAGDGSHRVPMQQFANQVPAIDSVRLLVVGRTERADG